MNIGHVRFIRPKQLLLNNFIKGYYVHSSSDPNFYSKVTFYQNITTTISVYYNSKTSSKGRVRHQHFLENNTYTSLLAGLVDRYQEVHFFGPLNRIAIVFYPLGINHFISAPLSELLQKHYSFFNFYSDFNELLDTVYQTAEIEGKRDLLDAYFLKKYRPFKETELIKAVNLLINTDSALKVNSLAEEIGMNRRTLLRKFRKHTGYSIEEYMSVIKFRKALFNYKKDMVSPKLSQIALESNYYDQADFNHQIKHRSDLTPSELFRQINLIDNTLFWKI